jgi:hypothetical protein
LGQEIQDAGIRWSKNGEASHGVFLGVREVKWEKFPNTRAKIQKLRMVGWATSTVWKQHIDLDVLRDFAQVETCNISLLRRSQNNRDIDHRFGNKLRPDYIALFAPGKRKSSNFQILLSQINNVKREYCRVCCETLRRPPHPILGYKEGNESHSQSFPCRGCFLAEPEKYR